MFSFLPISFPGEHGEASRTDSYAYAPYLWATYIPIGTAEAGLVVLCSH